jgi:pumilio family protein 6
MLVSFESSLLIAFKYCQELTVLWEKMRCHNVSSTERSKLVSEALRKMDGKYSEIAGSHVTARVLQTCVKLCSQSERDAIFEALQPDLLTLSLKKYAVFLVKKLIKRATKKQFEWFISSLHGRVAKLLRHTIGASVVDFAYQLATPPQKRRLLLELYSTELQLFTDLTGQKTHSLLETISNLGLQKSSVLQHMTTVIYPILEKGIVEYPIVHTAVLEYFTIADKVMLSIYCVAYLQSKHAFVGISFPFGLSLSHCPIMLDFADLGH